MKAVYVLPNGKSLGSSDFCRYFEKKVLYTVRKFEMPREVKVKRAPGLNSRVLLYLYDRFGFINPKSKTLALDDSADDLATKVMESWFDGKTPIFSPKTKTEIRPFYLMTDQEIAIYASIKRISGKPKKRTPARGMLDSMEKVHPEVKRAIVQSHLQLLGLRKSNL